MPHDVASHQTVRLSRGKHSGPDEGVCVMELASMLAGERFTDAPASVCSVVSAFMRTYNDSVDDARRQDLYAFAARAVGTAGDGQARRRGRLCAEALVADDGRRSPLRRALRRSRFGRHGAACAAAKELAKAEEGHAAALTLLDRLIAARELDTELAVTAAEPAVSAR
jgi:hypothetical protein